MGVLVGIEMSHRNPRRLQPANLGHRFQLDLGRIDTASHDPPGECPRIPAEGSAVSSFQEGVNLGW